MAKKAVKKTTVKKAASKAVKKVAVKKVAAKKIITTKTASKVAVKKVAAKKATVKKTTPKKVVVQKTAPVTTVIARVDVGFGNALYIRGEGPGLSWDKGVMMGNTAPEQWVWSTSAASGEVTFKVLINDDYWSAGLNSVVGAGERVVVEPAF